MNFLLRRRAPALIGSIVLLAVVGGAWWSRQAVESSDERKPKNLNRALANRPKAIVTDNVYDFGVMNPGDKRQRKFTVRNDGEGDLTLSLGKTTCKCTLASLDKAVIPPGGSTEIALDWHTEEPQFRFRQAAVINTNDPRLPEFELAVEGSVRTKLGSIPADVYYADVPKHASRDSEVLLYSQAFDKIEIQSIESTSSLISAVLTEDDPSPIGAPQESRYLRRIKVTKAPASKPGPFGAMVRVRYVGSFHGGPKETGTYELLVAGDTVGDLTLHGRSVAGTLLNLGTVTQSLGVKQKAYIHVRGESSAVSFAFDHATPEFLKVEIGKAEKLSPTMTRFPIEVSVSPGAPQVNFLSAETGQGEIVLKTTHADHPTVRFPVALAVLPN